MNRTGLKRPLNTKLVLMTKGSISNLKKANMKTILTVALSVCVFTGVMAQQKVSTHTKADVEQETNATLPVQDVQSRVEQKKSVAVQQVDKAKGIVQQEVQETALETKANHKQSSSVGINGQSVRAVAQSDFDGKLKGATVSDAASITGQSHQAVNAVNNVLANTAVRSTIKSSKNVQASTKVKTGVQVKPIKVDAHVKTGVGIKL